MAARPDPQADPVEGIGFNMTPMIDVVFQLIIFLMLANDMTRRDIEEVALPEARNGAEDAGLERDRVILNLERTEEGPVLRMRGVAHDPASLRTVLGPIARGVPDPEDSRRSGLHVLVRADARSRWQDVQQVLQACAAPEIGVHRIQIATREPAPGGRVIP